MLKSHIKMANVRTGILEALHIDIYKQCALQLNSQL